MIKQGSKAPKATKELQTNLNKLGYKTVVDGNFGPETDKTLRAFQKDNALKVDGIYGGFTDAVMDHLIASLPGPKVLVSSSGSAPHLDYLIANIGEKEIKGTKANKFICDLFNYTNLKHSRLALSDETAWCAAAMNAALVKNGFVGTDSASAASFDKYPGEKISPDNLKRGDLVTIKTSSGSHRHITCFEKWADKARRVFVGVGGNQHDMIKRSQFKKALIASVHRPEKAS